MKKGSEAPDLDLHHSDIIHLKKESFQIKIKDLKLENWMQRYQVNSIH